MMMLMMLTMWTEAGVSIGLETSFFMMDVALDLGENHPDRLVALYRGPWGDMINEY